MMLALSLVALSAALSITLSDEEYETMQASKLGADFVAGPASSAATGGTNKSKAVIKMENYIAV